MLQVHEPLSKTAAEIATMLQPQSVAAVGAAIPDAAPTTNDASESRPSELPLAELPLREPLSKPARNSAHGDA